MALCWEFFPLFFIEEFFKFPEKLWLQDNIKRVPRGIFHKFLPKWGPRFWNTIAADQLVFQNRGFTVQQIGVLVDI